MIQMIDRLTLEHQRLARLLDLLEGILDRFSEGTEPDFDLLSEMLEYMESYADQVHHRTEELIFDRLHDRIGERPEIIAIVSHQHKLIGQINRRFRQSLNGIINEEVLRRDEVEIQGRELIATLRQHMVLEEREAFPLALRLLTDEDWQAIGEIAPSASDPLFVMPDKTRFHTLYRELKDQAETQT